MSKAKFDQSICLTCGACIGACKGQAFDMKDGVIVYDESKCLDCDVCECAAGCPAEAIKK